MKTIDLKTPITWVLTLIVLSSIAITSCSVSPRTSQEKIKSFTPEQLVLSHRVSGLSFSNNGKRLLFTSDETGRPTAWEYDLNTKEKQIVHQDSQDPIYSHTMFDDGKGLVFTSLHEGSPFAHIYVKDKNGIRDVTPGDKVRARFRGEKADGSGFYFSANISSPREFNLYEFIYDTGETQLVFENKNKAYIGVISNSHKYLFVHESKTEEIIDLHVLNLETKEKIAISPDNNKSSFYGFDFSVDEKDVYYVTNHNSEFSHIEKYNFSSGSKTVVAKENWDILGATFSNDKKRLALYINENGDAKVKIKDLVSNQYLDIPFLEQNQIEKLIFSPNDQLIAMQTVSHDTPKDMWLLNIKTQESQQIYTSLNKDIDRQDFSKPQLVHIKSFDGLNIPAYLYQPKGIRKSSALVWTHGGPGGQFRNNYNQYIQHVVNQGHTVLAINNRGSSGYGKTFKSLDNRKHGIDDLKDILAGKKFLSKINEIDGDKIGIIGDSYGGYLVLAALTFHPNEFALGINMFGISNWLSVLNKIPDFWTYRKDALYQEMGHPQKDYEMLYNKSPLFFSDNIIRPLMVIHGAKDPKVPISESNTIVEKVKANNIPHHYRVFDNEGHSIRKKENQIVALNDIREFLDTHLAAGDK